MRSKSHKILQKRSLLLMCGFMLGFASKEAHTTRIALHQTKLSRRRRDSFIDTFIHRTITARISELFYQSTISIFIIWMALHISRSKQSDIPGFAWVLERQIERLQMSRFAFSLFASGAIDNGNLFADNLWRKVICDVSPQNMCKRIMKKVPWDIRRQCFFLLVV